MNNWKKSIHNAVSLKGRHFYDLLSSHTRIPLRRWQEVMWACLRCCGGNGTQNSAHDELDYLANYCALRRYAGDPGFTASVIRPETSAAVAAYSEASAGGHSTDGGAFERRERAMEAMEAEAMALRALIASATRRKQV